MTSTSFFNPDASTPWEMYGLTEVRMRELADQISELLQKHFFERKITRKEMLEQCHALGQTDAEMLYVHFSIGSGMSKAIQIKEQIMLKALFLREKAQDQPMPGNTIPFVKGGLA